MREREHWYLANTFSEMMYALMELEHQKGGLDLHSKMRRLKDLSAYSLAHDITYQREGVQLLALARLFGLDKREPLPEKPGAAQSFGQGNR